MFSYGIKLCRISIWRQHTVFLCAYFLFFFGGGTSMPIVDHYQWLTCSSLPNSPYFVSSSQKPLTRLTHLFPGFYIAPIYYWTWYRPEYSWNTAIWTLKSMINQSINWINIPTTLSTPTTKYLRYTCWMLSQIKNRHVCLSVPFNRIFISSYRGIIDSCCSFIIFVFLGLIIRCITLKSNSVLCNTIIY